MTHSRAPMVCLLGTLLLLLLCVCVAAVVSSTGPAAAAATAASDRTASSTTTTSSSFSTTNDDGWHASLLSHEDDLPVRRHGGRHTTARAHNMTPSDASDADVRVGGGIRAIANRVVHAMERKQPLLLLPLFDEETMLAHHSELPFGGTYKGRRGLQEFGERLDKTVDVQSDTCNITAIDEARGTALLECVHSATMRSTGKHVRARAVVALKSTCGRTLEVMNVVELDYNKLMDAYRTRPEQLLHKLSLVIARFGPMSKEAQTLWSDNVTISWSTLSNKNVLLTHNKTELASLAKAKHCGFNFMAWMEQRKSASQTLMSLDDNRVVTLEFSGDLGKQIRNFRSAPEGLYQMGAGTNDPLMAYTLWEFNDNGLLSAAHTLVNRPMTALDLYRLRENYGIVLNETDA